MYYFITTDTRIKSYDNINLQSQILNVSNIRSLV